ncbi:MAG: hypothetical protein H6660_02975 [Ardenticatenaceae bacterium]|nr:hypothetical protein [Ardenticatenaceae bacterium]
MYQILQATYQGGHLILNKKLEDGMEGKVLNVVVFEVDERENKQKQFLEFVDRHPILLSDTYSFNREEIYDR